MLKKSTFKYILRWRRQGSDFNADRLKHGLFASVGRCNRLKVLIYPESTRPAVRLSLLAIVALSWVLYPSHFVWGVDSVETLVFLRHGEKPSRGLGQLECKGLNRALALPAVLTTRFDKPVAIFAPDPAKKKQDGDTLYSYVRPLATIEPTAIRLELPVNTDFGFDDKESLEAALQVAAYRNGTVFIAWEHSMIRAIARDLLIAHGADPSLVKEWTSGDFDSIYIVTLTWAGDRAEASFGIDSEGLNGLGSSCPTH